MTDAEPSPPPRRPFQFGLATLLLVTALFSILSASLAGMLRGSFDSSMPPGFFILMAAAAPVGVAILISLFHAAVSLLKRRRR